MELVSFIEMPAELLPLIRLPSNASSIPSPFEPMMFELQTAAKEIPNLFGKAAVPLIFVPI